jgi:hypothetical protein
VHDLARDYVNFLHPVRKLTEKVRCGARVTLRYETAQTPYRRVLVSERHVDQESGERRIAGRLLLGVTKHEIGVDVDDHNLFNGSWLARRRIAGSGVPLTKCGMLTPQLRPGSRPAAYSILTNMRPYRPLAWTDVDLSPAYLSRE